MSGITVLALPLMKARLNRISSDSSMDVLFSAVLEAAEAELSKESGALVEDSPDDLMLLVDVAVWGYQSRDKTAGMPEWLRYKRRQRFLRLRK
jgi:hypothetical protein